MVTRNEKDITNAITTLLLFFVAEEKRVKRADYRRAREIATEIVVGRDTWLEAAGYKHELYVRDNREDLRPMDKYAALAGIVLAKMGVALPSLTVWAVNVGEFICWRLSNLGEEMDPAKLADEMEFFLYINDAQTTKPVPFVDHRRGEDMREFFKNGYADELRFVD